MTTANPAHTPGWAVAVLGALLLPLAGLGFALSFQMMLPVMVIAGWSVSIAWGGPVLVDIAAASGALMQMVSRDGGIRRWGTGVLGFSTLLSIFMNLAGHSIERAGQVLPAEYTGMKMGEGWQWVVILMSIATPLFIAVLVHAFGHVLMAYLAGRPARLPAGRQSARPDSAHPPVAARSRLAADSLPTARPDFRPTRPAVGTRPDPTPAADSHPTGLPTAADPTVESGTDRRPTDPTRLAADSIADLRESDESATRPDPTGQPTPNPTGLRVGYPTDPTATRPDSSDRPDSTPDSDPTESTDPTPQPAPDPTRPISRPDSESGADPTDPELTRLVERARELVESGEIRPTADSIRPALGVGSARAREIRDALKRDQRHGLRAVS